MFAIDQRNHGGSSHVSGMNYNLLSQDLASFIDEHINEPACIVGHSMGGKVAMTFADHYPDKVKSLVVLDIGIKSYEPRHSEIIEALKSLELHSFQNRQEIDQALSNWVNSAAVRQFLVKNVGRDDEGYRWKFNHAALLMNYGKLIAEVGMEYPFEGPTLFIRGSASDYILDRDWPVLQNFFPNSELVTLTGAGHWLHAEQPDRICDEVSLFFKRTGR